MIADEELDRLLQLNPLNHDPYQLQADYGKEAKEMIRSFQRAHRDGLLPLFAVPGVATRWQVFLKWLEQVEVSGDLAGVFCQYATSLGRLMARRNKSATLVLTQTG
jgi:hypothetical protein